MRPIQVLEEYEKGRRDFQDLDIEGSGKPGDDFVARALDGADFSGAFIVARFDRASLRGTRFVQANVKTCSFAGADLSSADFSGAALCSTTFPGARMDGATFEGAFFHSHDLGPGEFPHW